MKSTEIWNLFLMSLLITSCSRRSLIEQVNYDLKRAYQNKIEVQKLNITKTVTYNENGRRYDSIYFDANLLFTDDLFTDELKLNKGMKVITENDYFIYEDIDLIPIIVKFKLGYVKLEE